MNAITKPRELVTAYPYMFRSDAVNWTYEFYRGWFDLVVGACSDIDHVVRHDRFHHRFRILQMKEKFGRLRLYWTCRGMHRAVGVDVVAPATIREASAAHSLERSDASAAAMIREIVHAAESRSQGMCMHCGAPGTLRHGSWWATLCDQHAEMQQSGTLPASGFVAEDDWQIARAS